MEGQKLKIVHFVAELGLGCTSKTAVNFAVRFKKLGHNVEVWTCKTGLRSIELAENSIGLKIIDNSFIATSLVNDLDIFHYHDSGLKNEFINNLLPQLSPKTRVVLTNVFGGFCKFAHDFIDIKLFVSEATLVKYSLHGGKLNRKFDVLYNPVQETLIKPKNLVNENLNHKIVIGRIARPDLLKWDYDFELLLRLLKKTQFDFKLIIVGLPPEIKEKLLNLNMDIEFIESISNKVDLENFYKSIDALVHLSSIGESFGCVFVEAMNHGVPVVVKSTPISKHNFWRDNAQVEIIETYKTGLVCNNLLSMRDAILMLNKNFFSSDEIIKINELKFSSSKIANKLLLTYYKILNSDFQNKDINHYLSNHIKLNRDNVFYTPILSNHHYLNYYFELIFLNIFSKFRRFKQLLSHYKF